MDEIDRKKCKELLRYINSIYLTVNYNEEIFSKEEIGIIYNIQKMVKNINSSEIRYIEKFYRPSVFFGRIKISIFGYFFLTAIVVALALRYLSLPTVLIGVLWLCFSLFYIYIKRDYKVKIKVYLIEIEKTLKTLINPSVKSSV